VPFTGLGITTTGIAGNVEASVTIVVAGVAIRSTLLGKAKIKPDCTGTITYNQGQPDELNIEFVVTDDGNQIQGLQIDPGRNVLCHLRRLKPKPQLQPLDSK
jgi:hypothetical protein